MATTGSTNKSAFLRELFGKNPDLKLEQATEAWQKAGNEGEVSSSLFYNVKREHGGKAGGGGSSGGEAPRKPKVAAKEPKGKRAATPPVVALPESSSGAAPSRPTGGSETAERERVLDRVEDGIDDLIGELKRLGGLQDALEALRKARRVVVRSHEG